MSHFLRLSLLSFLVLGFATGCYRLSREGRTFPGRVDSFFVAPVETHNLSKLRAVAVLTETDVPKVVEMGFIDIYRVIGLQRSMREALIMSLGPALESLEFDEQDPVDGFDVLLRPRIDFERSGWFTNRWHIRITVTATDANGNLITEEVGTGEQGFYFLPDWSTAFRLALRRACQEVIPEVAASLDRHPMI